MANAGNVIGKVAVLQGQAFARTADGKLRALRVGDVVHEGEVIVTGPNSHVELAFDGGKTYLVRAQETVTLDNTVFGTDLPGSRDAALLDSAKTADEIARAIAQGGSLDDLLEETALTLGGGGADDGSTFVQLLRIVEALPPAGYDYGTDQTSPTAELVGGGGLNNAPPVAVDDAVSTDEDAPINIAVRGNDSDPENDVLTVTAVTNGAHGTVAIDPVSGNPVYTPNRNWNGTDTFTYTIDDGHGGTATAAVTVTVNPVNDAPVAGTIAVTADGTTTADPNSVGSGNYLHTIPEDTAVSGQVRATDVDGDALVYAQASNPAHGSAIVNPDGSYTYTPNANYNGNDSFTVLVSDGHGGTAVSTVSIVISPMPDPSVITAGFGSVVEDAVLSTSGRLAISDVDGPQDEHFTPLSNVAGAHGFFSIDANGDWTYSLNNGDPAVQALNAGQTMTEVFNVTGVDGTPSTVTVVINGANENAAPGAQDDSASTAPNVPVTINVLSNDHDPDGDPLTIAGFGQGGNGTVSLVSGQLVYTPNPGFSGTDSFTYAVSDGRGGTSSATVTVTVGIGGPLNQPPVANPDSTTTPANTAVTIAVLANDTDPESDPLTVTAASVPAAQGTVVVNADNTVTFTPAAGFTGNATISYTISDGAGTSSSTATVGVAAPVNQPPVANPDSTTTPANTAVTIAVLANDTDPESDPLTVTAASVPAAQGTVVVNADNTVTFTPAAGFTGNATISYTISDGTGTSSSTATVGVAAPANDAPVAVADSFAPVEDTPFNGNLATNDTPSGDGGNVWSKTTDPAHGVVVVNADGTFTYTPAANYSGPDSFTYTVTDADGSASTATVTLTVAAANDAPVAVADSFAPVEDTPFNGNLATNDTPSGDGGNVWSKTTDPAHGVVVVNADGTFTYTPAANYSGPDSFTYTVTDADGSASTATVTLTVAAANDAPVAVADSFAPVEDTPFNGNLATNDTPSGDGGNVWSKTTDPAHGVVVVNADGTFTYTPAANYSGPDSFTYTVTDADGSASTATVTLTVAPANDAPVAVADSFAPVEDTPFNGNLATNDTPSGDGGNVWSKTTDPAHGVVVVNADGTFTYTPAANYSGPDSFTYTVTDADGSASTATVTLTVAAANDAPVAVADSFAPVEDTPFNGNLATNDTPSGDGGNVWSKTTDPAHGVVVVNADGTFTYTPAANYSGPDSFTYTVTDADGSASTATVTLTVAAANDAPVAVADSFAPVEDTPFNGNLATNDTPSGDGGNVWSKTTDPAHGVVVVNADGTFTYTPAANYSGPDSFTYTVTDADGSASTATVTLTVAAANDAPVAVADSFAPVEDTPFNGNLATNDTPSGDGGNVWSKTTDPAHGVVVVNADGTFTYTPAANYSGPDSFTYTVTDADGSASTATVTLTVAPANDAPVAVADSFAPVEDTPFNGNLATNDTPSGDGGNVWSKTTDPAHGVVVVNADGTFTYTPAANYSGPDSFTYTVTDADGSASTATVTLTVAAANDAPVAVADSFAPVEDTPFNGNLATNDTPSGDGGNVWSKTTDPAHGVVVVNADGTFTYTPAANYSGPDSFTYTVTDADGSASTATVTLTVAAANDAPVAVADSFAPVEDTPFNGNLATNDTPSGDGGNVWSKTTDPAHGVVVVNADGTFTYTPAANYSGPDSFTYTVTDADGSASTATVTLTVAPANDAPVAVADSFAPVEDTPFNGNLATNDTPSGDGGNVWSKTTDPAHGVVVVNADGTFTYTPAANYSGPDSFTYTVTDADGSASTATVTLTVAAANDAPVAVADSFAPVEDTPFNGNLATNDTPSGDGGNVWSKTTDPAHGVVVVNADGTFTYTPAANYSGPDSFTYTVTDADGSASTATVTLTVAPANDAPVAVADSFAPVEDTPFNGNLATNDTPSGDGGNVWSKTTDPAHGVVVVNADGTFTYTPAANYSGPDSFTYTVTDADGSASTATVTLTVAPANDAPVAVADSFAPVEDTPFNGNLATNDTPSGDGGNVWSKTTDPAHGVVVVNADGTFTYTPAANYSGPDSFTYTVTDADGSASTATVTLTVAAANDAPVAVADSFAPVEDTPFNGNLATNDTPSGDGGNVWSKTTDPAHGVVVVNADGTFTYTPAANYSGPDSFTYTVTDADGSASTATVTLTVAAANDAPTATGGTASGSEDTPLVFNWGQFNIADVDTPVASLSVRVTSLPVDGTLQHFDTATSSWTAVALNQVISKADVDAGRFRLVPDLNESGIDGYATAGTGNLRQDYASFDYQGSDGVASSATATMRVDVAPLADMPTLTITNSAAAVMFNTSWETVANTNNTSTNAGAGPIEGWTLLTTPEGQADGTDGFEVWTEGDTQQRQDTGYNAVFAATGNGVNWLELNDSAGTLVQTIGVSRSIATQAGMVYEVSLDYAGRPGFTTAYTAIAIQVDGVTVATYADTSPQSGLDWKNLTFSLVGDGAAHTIALLTTPTAYNSGGRGAMIDDITVTGYQGVTAGNASGGTATDIDLYRYVTASLVDTDTSEALTVTFGNLPAGAQIITASHTYSASGGTIVVPGGELGTAVLRIGGGFTGDLHLDVTATATESVAGGVATTAAQVLDIHVTAPAGNVQAVDIADPWSSLALAGTSGGDTIAGGAGDDTISGLAGADSLWGNAGNDVLVGGQGNDTLTGGTGSDTFRWGLGDGGTTASVARDTISDFDSAAAGAGGDVLDLRDLLSPTGGTASGLDNFLHFQYSGGDTTIYVSATGAFNNNNAVGAPPANVSNNDVQQIVVQGVNLIGSSTTDQQVIQNLLNANKLLVD